MHELAIFIDAAYLSNTFKDQFSGRRVNFKVLPDWIRDKLDIPKAGLIRTYFYDCLPLEIDEDFLIRNKPSKSYCHNCMIEHARERLKKKKNFLFRVEMIPQFEVRLGRLVFRGWRKETEKDEVCEHGIKYVQPILRQKGVDLLLAVDLIHFASTQRIKRAAIIAGDADFVPAVDVAKLHGVIVILIHGGKPSPPHQGLSLACDDRIELDDVAASQISIPQS